MKCQEANNLLLGIDSMIRDIKASSQPPTIQSYLAKYLIVAVSSAYQESLKQIILQYTSNVSTNELHSFVGGTLERTPNPSAKYVKETIKNFSPKWHRALLRLKIDRFNDMDSINSLRNSIAHGTQVSVTLNDAVKYYKSSKKIIEKVDLLLLGR